jgi:hypothetical protein
MLPAFTVAPLNENDKTHFKPLLEKVHSLRVKFRAVLADAQYSARKVRETARGYGSAGHLRQERARGFVTRGARRLVEMFRRR